MAQGLLWSGDKDRDRGDEASTDLEDSPKVNAVDIEDREKEEDDTESPAASPQSPQTYTSPPPNGGYGWVCTVCIALINAHTWGLNSSYGVFLAHYLANDTFPGAGPLQYAFVGSLSISCAMLVSPLATISTRELGTKVSMAIGILFESGSLIGASWASKTWQLFLSQGVAFGIGMGFLFVSSVGIVPQWFTTRRSLANGIATSGSGFGGLLYSLATGAMIESIGLAWAFRVLGILCFAVNTVCAILVKDRNKAVGSRQAAFDVSLFRRVEYDLLLGFGWFSMLAYMVLIFSLANYANVIGLNASQASVVSALLNLGQAFGRPPIGYFSDTIGRINMAGLMTFLAGLFSLVIWTFAKSYAVLIVFALIGGTVAGTFWCTIAPVTAEVVGLPDVPSGLNLIWLAIVLPCTFSEPIALEIVQGTGSYLGTQLFTGFMYVAAAACMLALRGWKIGELEDSCRSETEGGLSAAHGDGAELTTVESRKVGRRKMFVDCWKWRKV